MLRIVIVSVGLAAPIATAQILTVPPGPVSAGTIGVSVQNDLPSGILFYDGPFALLHPTGELVHPAATVFEDVPSTLSVGQTKTFLFSIPFAPAIPSGSYVLLFPHPGDAGGAARLDVVAADAQFPSLHAFPPRAHAGYSSHRLALTPAWNDHWRLANTSGFPHTFGVGDVIRIFAPGAGSPLATVPLNGVFVPAGKVVAVPLPLATLGEGVYTVETSWNDPAAGPIVRRAGVRPPLPSGAADLALPEGKVVPSGGSLPVRFLALGPAASPLYLLLASIQPGSQPVPGGLDLPLAADAVFLASANSGLFGLLTNHTGTMGGGPPPCSECIAHAHAAAGLSVVHPNLPAASGVTMRLAGVAFEPTSGTWLVTQGEEVTFE